MCRAYTTVEQPLNAEAAQTLLEEQLHQRLLDMVGTGTVQEEQFSAKVEHDVLTVTLTAECEEEIGREGPLTDRAGGAQAEETN